MGNINNHDKPAGVEKRGWLRKNFVAILILLLVIAISAGLYFYARDPERVTGLKNYGYLGAFLVALVGNATILLPVTVLPIHFAISIVLYPVTGPVGPIIVGLAGGVGAGIGEITGYMLGYSGRGVIKNSAMYLRLVGWMRRWGSLAIFVLSAAPLPFDLTGMAAGVLRFPLWKFILACWAGRTLIYVSLNLLTAVWGWEAALRFFS
ncbi:VTT domain-containing protein [Chloroflexota bacterium]